MNLRAQRARSGRKVLSDAKWTIEYLKDAELWEIRASSPA